VVLGVVVVAWPPPDEVTGSNRLRAGSALAGCAALAFGLSLYATGHVAALPLAWVVVPSRIVGVTLVAIPLAVTRRLRVSRSVVPHVVAAGVCEVLGFAFYALGARSDIAVAAVIASMFGAVAAVGAYLVFSERMGSSARIGVVVIAVGVATLSALHQ